MNTRASVAYGWGVLCLAGGGAYYFAKRSINSDRAERAAAEEARRQQRERMRVTETASRDAKLGGSTSAKNEKSKGEKKAPNAEKPEHVDPAAVEHVQQLSGSDSKFEAKVPFRSRKGDRFS